MKIFLLAASFLLPICASATCNIPAGALTVPKIRFTNNSIYIGCVNDTLEFVSPETRSTYSWVSTGKIDSPSSSADKLSIHIDSKIVLYSSGWVSISSNGSLIGRGFIAAINDRYAKIENGFVTAVVVVNRIDGNRNFKFPRNENWILMPRTLTFQVGSEKIGRGYRYERGQFSPPNELPDGTGN